MSDKKQVIHVKDLVIKADNVRIEPQRQRRDPFFGPRVMGERDESPESPEKRDDHDDRESSENKDDRDREPFSWI
ncbi:hypothetical protein ACFQ3N_20255 [Virgibacillus byunsanensis]|uniref:Uncharacterized protein n=1 Tax=Virgibacillus byunsanensis TaxID=570945 RepID=A0ABW3LQQ3_9BACI